MAVLIEVVIVVAVVYEFNPFAMSRMRHMVNSYPEYSWLEFNIFLLLEWLPLTRLKSFVLSIILPTAEERRDELMPLDISLK